MTQIQVGVVDDEPHTHALVIGVGYYQHLIGGPDPDDEVHLGLSVLNSPPISALALANWMLGVGNPGGARLHNPAAPLATVEILISSDPGSQLMVDGTTYSIERASLQNVQNGFNRWLQEVGRNPNNVGVIYFCGHGLTNNAHNHILLLDDHGAQRNSPFSTGSFDLSNTLRALSRRVPAPMYIFIDACRSYNRSAIGQLAVNPAPLLSSMMSTSNINQGTTWFRSTAEGKLAYGDNQGVSRFTDALLRALAGYCGVPEPGTSNWLTNGDALSRAMPKLLDMVNRERGGKEQTCEPLCSGRTDTPLHVTTEIPKVKVEINLTPVNLRTSSNFSIQNLVNRAKPPIVGGGMAGIWQTEADRGMYGVQVTSEERRLYAIEDQSFEPPLYHLPVRVQP